MTTDINPQTLVREMGAAAREAGARAMELLRSSNEVHVKGRHDFVTDADLAVHRCLSAALPDLLPGSRVLSEEGEEKYLSPRELAERDTFILDPIDGTTNFIYRMGLSAVSIGLLREGKPLAGVVFNPFTGELFSAVRGQGAFLNGAAVRVVPDSRVEDALILFETNPYGDRASGVSLGVIKRVFDRCIDFRVTGSAALDLCYVACGRGSALISEHLKPWDYAAGLLILEEAGGKATDWELKDLPFSAPSTVLATNGLLHHELYTLIRPDRQ